MKSIFFAFTLLIVSAVKGQAPGKAEYDKAEAAFEKHKHEKANKLYEEACDKGYNEACKALWTIFYASDNQRIAAKKKSAERGYPEGMYAYACTLGPAEFTRRVQLFTKAGEAGNKQASLALAELYETNTPIHDTAIAARIYQYWAAHSDTSAWRKMVMLQNNNKEALFYLATVYQKKYEEHKLNEDERNKFYHWDLYEMASKLGHGEASYRRGLIEMSVQSLANAKMYFDLAIRQGYPVPEKDMSYVAYLLSPAGRKQQDEIDERNAAYSSKPSPSYSPAASSSTQLNRKTCPICNGTGKMTDRYTSEKRDWNNKTITMTDHVTTKPCSRCNGKGYYTY